jgi:hypothetical protein
MQGLTRRSATQSRARSAAWTIAALAALSVAGAAPAQEPAAAADLVLRGGRVITLDPADRVAEAVAIRGNRIVAVGSGAEMAALAGPRTRVVELAGRAVVPGFIDAHCHIEHTARFLHFYLDLHSPPLPAASAAVLEAVRRRAAELPPGSWIVGQGTYGTAMPARDELDRGVPNHPVALRWSVHDVLVNRRALELAGIDRSTPDPPGGKIERGADGEPTGILREAFDLLPIPPYDPSRLREALRDTLQKVFLEQGVTTAYELPASAAGVAAYQHLEQRGELPIRLQLGFTIAPGHQPLGDLDALLATGLRTGFGNDRLRIGPIKIFVDGSGPSAATYLPDQPGLQMRSGETLASEVLRAHRAGWQLWIHAIGDRAQDLALDALESALATAPRADPRHRIEHLGNVWREPAIERAERLGVIPVPTAAFMWLVPDETARGGGPPLYPFRTLLDRGHRPPGNADTAGTQTFAINPMFSLSREVLRTNWNGVPVSPKEAVSITEALRIHTLYAAHAGFEEKEKGSIEPGKLADLVVLSRDPLTTPPERLMEIEVDLTLLDGRIAYRRNAAEP